MKSKIIVSNTPLKKGLQFGNIWFDADSHLIRGNKIIFMIGYSISVGCETLDGVLDRFEKDGFKGLNEMKGEYTVIIYNKDEDCIYAANDMFANREMLCYKNEGKIVLSTDFWRIVDIIEPNYEMLDIDAICRFAIQGQPHHNSTILKNVRGLEFGSNNTFDLKARKHKEEIYNHYKDFDPKDISIEDAAEEFNKAILASRDYVLKKHPAERLAISISGGLDSRFMPAIYGKDHEYFVITGQPYIHSKIKPYNINYIDKIGKAYGIKIKKVNYSNTSVKRKLFLDVCNCPMAGETFLKDVDKSEIESDVLIFCGGRDLLSSSRGMYASGWSLYDIAEKYEGSRYLSKSTSGKMKKLWTILSEGRSSLRVDDDIEYTDFFPIKIMSHEDFYYRSHKYFDEFTHFGEKPEKAILYYRYSNSLENSYGAYESLSGQMKATYNYYYPFAIDSLKTLPMNLVKDRIILKYLIDNYYPEVSKIEGEHCINGIHDERKISPLTIFKAIISQKIRGCAGMPLTPEMKLEYLQEFDENGSTWYDAIFDTEMVRGVVDKNPHIFLNHLKIRILLSSIESRNWKKYII